MDAFMGQAISDPGNTGNVQLWNKYGTGKLLYVERIVVSGTDHPGADIRKCKVAIGTVFPDHITNKRIDGPASAAELRTFAGTPPNDDPYNRPIQEIWLGGSWDDKTYLFDPPIVIPQGRGVAVSMAGGTNRCIASFQWREEADPLGVVIGEPPPPGIIPGGIVCADLTNPTNAFDSNDATYANDSETSQFYVGKIWDVDTAISRFVVKSPSGRSFSGANPGRNLTWKLETYDGAAWSVYQTGTYTEPGSGSTQSVIDVSVSVAARGHRIRIVNTAAAAHRVGTVSFYS
jgi:hypothetical protein